MRQNLLSSVLSSALVIGCGDAPKPVGADSSGVVTGGAFTTFDATRGGCKDSKNGVDCNNYVAKDDVYMSGGPLASGLGDGTYYFAVLVPGYQNGGFVDGADGNLSDTTAGATHGDLGSGDAVSNRTFTVSGHQIASYTGTHALGTSPDGRTIIQLSPYDDTSNTDGVYILAVCQSGATSPKQCKFDAFHVPLPVAVPGVVAGGKYYDANANGVWDTGEVGIAGWPIDYTGAATTTVLTDANGAFSLSLDAASYVFREELAAAPWMQTGNLVSQLSVTGGASALLEADKSYVVSVVDNSTVSGVYFGNLCLGAGGGLTLGFWSNKNGQALITADDLALLDALHLRNADGTDYDPASASDLHTWLLSATAVNMANMLSAQLATMELNVATGNVAGGSLVYAPGATGANQNGFLTVSALMAEADAALAADGNTVSGDANRAYQQALEQALDAANNNLTFVQPGPSSCPTPVF